MYGRAFMVFGKMYWIYLACVTSVSCTMLQYNSKENKLTIRCPGDTSRLEGNVQSYRVQHVADNGQVTDFIDMKTADDPKTKNKVGQRVQFHILPDSQQLIGEVSNADCYDSGLYKCFVILFSKSKAYYRSNSSDEFRFPGSKPSISTPEKSCFQVGDVLQLNCTSRGSRLVWEASGQGGRFAPLSSASPVQQNRSGDCAAPVLLPLRHVISSDDSGRTFRCKVQGSDHLAAQVTVAVDCGQGCSTTTPTRSSSSSSIITTSSSSSSSAAVAKDVNKAQEQSNDDTLEPEVRAGQVRSQSGDAEPQSGQTALVVVVSCAGGVIIVILLVILWRQKQRKQLQPLVVVDSLPPSEYSATFSDRKLPNLPHLDQWLPAGNTTPKWVADQQLGSDDDLVRAQRDTNASIYVSMDNLNKSGLTGNASQANGDCSQRSATTPEPEVLEPDMRSDRSESLYSNSEAIDREAAARARALVPDV